MGADSARALAPYETSLLILASRSADKIEKVIKDLDIKPSTTVKSLELDLASQSSVREAAAKVLQWTTTVDAVIETAGVMAVPSYQVNDEVVELTFAANHLGHFLFTNLIMERLLAAKDGGVVVPFTSEAHKRGILNLKNINFDVRWSFLDSEARMLILNRTTRTMRSGRHMEYVSQMRDEPNKY